MCLATVQELPPYRRQYRCQLLLLQFDILLEFLVLCLSGTIMHELRLESQMFDDEIKLIS